MATTNTFLILSEDMFKGLSNQPSADDAMRNPSQSYGTFSKNLPGAIEVLEFGFKIEQIGSEQSGRPRSVESVERSRFTFKKAVDARSPKLFKWCCDGTLIWQAECQVFGPVPNTPYLTYYMGHVHISSYEPSGSDDVPTETIELTFGEMGVKFNNAGIGGATHGNSRSGSVQTKWSWIFDVEGLDLVARGMGSLGTGSAF